VVEARRQRVDDAQQLLAHLDGCGRGRAAPEEAAHRALASSGSLVIAIERDDDHHRATHIPTKEAAIVLSA